jgi:competence protein ComEC
MRINSLIFCIALASLIYWPSLLAPHWTALCALSGLGAALVSNYGRRAAAIGWLGAMLARVSALLFGLALANWHGHLHMQRLLPANCDQHTFQLTGVVVGLPYLESVRNTSRARLAIQVDSLSGVDGAPGAAECRAGAALLGRRLQLHWYAPPPLHAGERWSLRAKLRRPRGLVNPRGQDYQLRLMREGWSATGTVHSGRRLGSGGAGLDQRRDSWRNFVQARIPDAELAAILTALSVGERRGLSAQSREMLLHTGTAHLLAISGLHVGMMALLGFFVGRLVYGVCIAVLPVAVLAHINGAVVGAITSVGFASIYAALSGFALSTQRALLMVVLYHLGRHLGWRWGVWELLLLTLCLVLAWQPLQASEPGLYLSFGAVFTLLFALGGRSYVGAPWRNRARRWLLPQWWIFLGLLPLSVALFSGVSLLAVLANSGAIPWVTLTTVPALMLAFMVQPWAPDVASEILALAALSVRGLQWTLAQLAALAGDLGWLDVRITPAQWWILSCLSLLCLVPVGGWVRGVALASVLWVLIAHFWLTSATFSRERRVTLFDVGQGLAVLVEVDGERLLYDTGPPLGQFSSAAERVILPYLQARGIRQLDYLVVSHNDADHAGGVQALLSRVGARHIYAGEAPQLAARLSPLLAGPDPSADRPGGLTGVRSCHGQQAPGRLGRDAYFWFDGGGAASTGNNASCVMWLEFADLRVLLPGDVDQSREFNLALMQTPGLPASAAGAKPVYVVAPHHGSQSSSSYALLSRLGRPAVLVSAGYGSRYGHPHPNVIAKYRALGLPVFNSAELGALQLVWQPGGFIELRRWRHYGRRFWFER